jgi:hypothetical protein
MTRAPERPSIPMPEFSAEQVDALVDYMEAHGRERGRQQGANFNEVDYLVGCMTAMFALGKQGSMPAGWMFGPLANISPLGLPTLDREVFVVHDPRDRQGKVTVYERQDLASDHAEWLEEQGRSTATWFRAKVRHELRPDIEQAMLAAEPQDA